MRERILQLENISKLLDPEATERDKARGPVVNYSERFLEELQEMRAYNVGSNKGESLRGSPIDDEPARIEVLIELLRNNVDSPGLNPASGGHLGYIPGGGLYYSALGDYLAAVFNRYAALFTIGPGAVTLENMVIDWMAEIVGFPKDAGGNLTTGGSLANLMAIVAAREAKKIRSADVPRSVIYLSEDGHHSFEKAIRISGLSECKLRKIRLDSHRRMDVSELERQIELDKGDGLSPFLVVASAGTTNVGAIDPLYDIGKICQRNNFWYHIDAAYGGFFILTEEGKKRLSGIELADSITLDPHKGLFLPYGSGVILVKDRNALNAPFFQRAPYMSEPPAPGEEPSPCDLSPELTKHFRGLRLWLPLKLHGVRPFRACLEEKLLLAKYFHSQIRKCGFEVGPEPDLSVVTYRYVPADITNDPEKVDDFNKELLKAVHYDGRVFISETKLEERFTLRFACLSFRTHLKAVDLLLEVLKENVATLEEVYGFNRAESQRVEEPSS